MTLSRRIQVLGLVALFLSVAGCASIENLFGKKEPEDQFTTEQLREMGEKYLAAGALGQALKMLTVAENRAPADPVIQYDLGSAYEQRGMYDQAFTHYQKAITLKPDFSEAHNALGAFYAGRNDLDKAEWHFKRALGNPFYETPHLVCYNLGLLYEKQGQPELAMQQYQEAVRLQPAYGLAWYHIGMLYEAMRRADAAREAYGRAIESAPDLVDAHLRYGVMSYTAGEMENALYSLNRVVKLSPHSNSASEARRYLERFQGMTVSGSGSRSFTLSPSERLSHMEVMGDQDLLPQSARSSSTVPSSPRPAAADTFMQDKKAAALSPKSQPKPLEQAPPAAPAQPPPDTHWTYIVQVGSFLDKDNAEALRNKLKSSGYDPVVKPLQHQVLGQVYIVQLKPVTDEAQASSLMAQVEKDEEVKPIIIKVPAGN